MPLVLILALAVVGGVMFLTGKTSPSGENEWVTYARAQVMGDPQAQYIKAIVADTGKDRNEAEAIEWYSKAAEQGHVSAMMGLADIYDKKTDTSSRTLAAHWYAEAARNGDGRAQYQLAQYHIKSWGGLTPDPAKIAHLLQQSADAGYGPSLTRYGVELRAQGKLDEALPWFRKGAARGDLEALYNLGEIYADPQNGELTDVIRAVTYFEEAANLGHVPSQLKYAYLCLAGQGLPRDPAEAYKWAEIASQTANSAQKEAALEVREYLRTKIAPDEQHSGEMRAQDWLKTRS
ncbi:tetratricopeptide repeat protein [Asticcacaulis sp. SL142]|uniref:tetratricopeptide repeat protein n=1 Tax=Asticcacaulis sp. SL142 TaxID=2995155 RepID=UPI00226CD033|nr:tetratricopeptide repeat protein [Asticcacaulis sp. SL142]WAC49837.1 tetratricopeptide repeat protein [Asticcacaulis sp. SL142]